MTNAEQIKLLNEYINYNTIFGKTVVDLSNEELDNLPKTLRKKVLTEMVSSLKKRGVL